MKKVKKYNKTKVLKILVVILLVVLLVELILFGFKLNKRRENNPYYTLVSDVLKIDDGYVGIGLSDFKHSKLNDFNKGDPERAVVFKYDSDFNVIKEVKVTEGFKSYLNKITKVEDGYIAVGTIQMTKEQVESSVGEAMIIKYDNDLKQVWRKNFKILDNTEFNDVEVDEKGNLIVVGRSIYASDIIGNHSTGGAIIVKFSSDGKELKRANYGGPQVGVYNDVLLVDDGYVVVGASSKTTGIIRKYDLNFKEVWRNFYVSCDQEGFTSVAKVDDSYVVTGSKLLDKKNVDEYKALLAKYDSKGELVYEVSYKKDKINRFDDILYDDDTIFVSGFTGSKKDNNLSTDGVMLSYSDDLVKKDEKFLSLEGNEAFSRVYKDDKGYLFLGYTSSKYKPSKTNGYDYYPVFTKLDKSLK